MSTGLSTRRLVAATTAVFLVIFAFLAGRVHAGADPTQVARPTSSVTQSDPAPGSTESDGTDPYGVPGDDGADPYGVPGDVAPSQGGGAVPDADPPITHAS
jgi:hypothetical protein